MKALILNSGVGSRLKSLKTCKCLVELADSVSIFDSQIYALLHCGVEEIYITTGFRADVIKNYARGRYPGVNIKFIHNPLYDKTNYIYSIQLAQGFLRESDILLLHGDLVFEQNVLQDIITSDFSVMAVDSAKPLPEKDFKAQIINSQITRIGVDVYENALYAQPMYKLIKDDWAIWAHQIDSFCNCGITDCYAENAFNEVSDKMSMIPLDITGRLCFEVDTDEDLSYARECFAAMPDRLQEVYAGDGSRKYANDVLLHNDVKKPFIVCGIDIETVTVLLSDNNDEPANHGYNPLIYTDFKPNPGDDDITRAREAYKREGCDFIVSIGGGSAIDVAKVISYDMPHSKHLAIPTSAGTGSESTSFAAVYRNGAKYSIENVQLIPDYAILDAYFLKTLPEYHRKSALLDALCQAIESLWAGGRTTASTSYARAAYRIIYDNVAGYLEGDPRCAQCMLYAANLSGKAINIGKTTAAHAMSYRISTHFNIAHGHAVALCLIPVWEQLLKTGNAPKELTEAEYDRFCSLFKSLEMPKVFSNNADDIEKILTELTESVNIERLSNHPITLTQHELTEMYRKLIFNYE